MVLAAGATAPKSVQGTIVTWSQQVEARVWRSESSFRTRSVPGSARIPAGKTAQQSNPTFLAHRKGQRFKIESLFVCRITIALS